jgi:preprotein translocase subunit SecA
MIENIIKTIFGDPSDKQVNKYSKMLPQVHIFEEQFKDFSPEDVRAKTAQYQALFQGLDFHKPEDSVKISEILEDIKLEAFALVKQACKLLNGTSHILADGKEIVWNMIPYDVQLIGGLAIHGGSI